MGLVVLITPSAACVPPVPVPFGPLTRAVISTAAVAEVSWPGSKSKTTVTNWFDEVSIVNVLMSMFTVRVFEVK